MRKFSGVLIACVALFFLGLAYAQFARAADPTCDSVLAGKIVELVKADKSKILDMQFELTALKLARETLKSNHKTTEGYIKNQEALLTKLDDQGIREKLKKLYQTFGETADADKIEKELAESIGKVKGASYIKKETRFKNKDLSAYVLAKVLSDDKGTEYDINDASILWYRSEISEGVEAQSHRGSAAANLQEVSTRVAQLTGIAGTKGKSLDEIMQLIADTQQIIGEEFDRIKTLFTDDEKKSCAELEKCATCKVDEEEARIGDIQKRAMNKALTAIVENVQKDPAAKAEVIKKVVDDLKSKGIAVERDPAGVKDATKKAEKVAIDPNAKPSTTPSAKPSTTPSAKPSTTPSAKPSTTPSVKPSTTPSVKPSPVTGLPAVKSGKHGGTLLKSSDAGSNPDLNQSGD